MTIIVIAVVTGIVVGLAFLAVAIKRAPLRDDWDEPSRLDHMDGIRHPDQRDL